MNRFQTLLSISTCGAVQVDPQVDPRLTALAFSAFQRLMKLKYDESVFKRCSFKFNVLLQRIVRPYVEGMLVLDFRSYAVPPSLARGLPRDAVHYLLAGGQGRLTLHQSPHLFSLPRDAVR